MSVLLEIAIGSVEDALAARAGGADRLELNSALELGGLTPSLGALIEVKRAASLPVLVMIRPRPGGFAYGDAEFAIMRRDLDLALQYGADGIVFGVLCENGTIDVDRCRTLVRQTGDREAVFHRAFDVTPDPVVALQQLIDLGVRRVMTSGQEETAYNGSRLIAELIHRSAGRIEILPAGGINAFTVADVLSRTGCTQIHAGLRGSRTDRSVEARPHLSFGTALRRVEGWYDAVDEHSVARLKQHLHFKD